MNESDARKVFLLRSFETASPPAEHWTGQDRDWATRAAAGIEGEAASRERFIARRAQLAVERLCKRERRIGRALDAVTWRPWVGWILAVLAFALGTATDAIGREQRINVLAPPLLAVMAWNLLVYLLTAGRALAGTLGKGKPGRLSGPLSRLLARAAHLAMPGAREGAAERAATAKAGAPAAASSDATVLAAFLRDWTRSSAALNARRLSRLLHVAAICFALGALAGLYLRGLAFEYRAGWESTFLEATSLRALLHALLGPAAALTGIALPDIARLEAMRFPGSAGEQAGPWIHLYAVTVALVVLLPRAALALFDFVQERRQQADFPIALDEAYFAALGRALRGEATPVAVLPYNHEPAARTVPALERLLGPQLGANLALALLPAVPYGQEEAAADAFAESGPLALVALLVSSTATPEAETHGRFIGFAVRALPPGTPLLVLVDESAFVARFGTDATARRRREERRQAWIRLLADDEHKPVFVELATDAPANETALRAALAALGPLPATAAQGQAR